MPAVSTRQNKPLRSDGGSAMKILRYALRLGMQEWARVWIQYEYRNQAQREHAGHSNYLKKAFHVRTMHF